MTTYQYKLLEVRLNDGTIFRPSNLTVLIGPNNVGKSRALKEIAALTSVNQPPEGIVVSSVSVDYPANLGELRRTYDVEPEQEGNGMWTFRTLSPDLSGEQPVSLGQQWPRYFDDVLMDRLPQKESTFAQHFGPAMVAFLTTGSRLQLVRKGRSPSRDRESSSLLQLLYNAGSGATAEISTLVKEAFGKEIALDFTVLQELQLRVGDDFTGVPADPRDARPVMREYEQLDDQGDGIRSFVGIVVALVALKRGLFLIDEPEAFLHPPQAFRMGALIATHADRSRQILLATHSADLLRGVLSRTQSVDIIRIDRVGNTNTFKPLSPGRLKEIANDPLLTSARVLDGLFYSGAVVVEADSDARFYQAASVKRLRNLDLHFVNADNKQTVSRIVRLYRDMGVRAAGIVDFDVLNNRTELEKSLGEVGFPDGEIRPLLEVQRRVGQVAKELPPEVRFANVRAELEAVRTRLDQVAGQTFLSADEEQATKEKALRQMENRLREMVETTKAWKTLKQQGRAALPPDVQADFDRLWKLCADRGLFINPCGELESMLTEYGVPATTDKKAWITQALQLVQGLAPDDQKNPWRFLKSVHEHLRASEGAGVPAES